MKPICGNMSVLPAAAMIGLLALGAHGSEAEPEGDAAILAEPMTAEHEKLRDARRTIAEVIGSLEARFAAFDEICAKWDREQRALRERDPVHPLAHTAPSMMCRQDRRADVRMHAEWVAARLDAIGIDDVAREIGLPPFHIADPAHLDSEMRNMERLLTHMRAAGVP